MTPLHSHSSSHGAALQTLLTAPCLPHAGPRARHDRWLQLFSRGLIAAGALALNCKPDVPTDHTGTASSPARRPAGAPSSSAANSSHPAPVTDPNSRTAPPLASGALSNAAPVSFKMSLPGPETAEVRVLAPGRTPREQLRYSLPKDQKQTFRLRVSLEPQLTVGGRRAPGATDVRLDVHGDIDVAASSAAGGIQRTAVFQSFAATSQAIPPAALSQLQMQFAALDGLRIRDSMDNRGQLQAGELELPVTPSAEQREALQTFTDGLAHALPPLPEEAVGQGARWSSTESVVFQGIRLTQVSSFELTQIQGTRITVLWQIRQSADSQVIQAAALPAGATVYLESLRGEGTGQASVDRANLALQSTIKLNIVVKTKIRVPGKADVASNASTALSWGLTQAQ